MEHELSRRDIIDYKWHTRDYIARSSTTPQVFTYVDFCPWCGKYVGNHYVQANYIEAYDKAKQEDPTLPDIRSHSALEGFQERFLRDWEAENQTLEGNQTLYYNQERLHELLTNAKDDGLVVPRAQILDTPQTEKIINAVIDEAGLDSTEEALILLAIIFQKGGAARQCDGNLEAEAGGKKLRLETVRDCMRGVGLAGMEWRLARSLATPIYERGLSRKNSSTYRYSLQIEEERDRQSLPHALKVLHCNTVRGSAIEATCPSHNRAEVCNFLLCIDQHLNTSHGLSCCATSAIERSGTVDERQGVCQRKLHLLVRNRGRGWDRNSLKHRT
jgi:hypothetical protein